MAGKKTDVAKLLQWHKDFLSFGKDLEGDNRRAHEALARCLEGKRNQYSFLKSVGVLNAWVQLLLVLCNVPHQKKDSTVENLLRHLLNELEKKNAAKQSGENETKRCEAGTRNVKRRKKLLV